MPYYCNNEIKLYFKETLLYEGILVSNKLQFLVKGHAANCEGAEGAEVAEGAEAFPLLENMYKGARNWRYNDLLRSLEKHMTTKVFNRIKYCLKGIN